MVTRPHPAPAAIGISPPEDTPYAGVIVLDVDAADLDRRIFRVRETVPVTRAGNLTLLYPKWLPGYHSPDAPIELFAGFIIRADDQELTWRRDAVEMHAFHIDVPEGVTSLNLEFEFLSPTSPTQGRVIVTPEMLNLQWNTVLLYPAGYFARGITVTPSITLPPDWLRPVGSVAVGGHDVVRSSPTRRSRGFANVRRPLLPANRTRCRR
ncbi:hypothetical protein [Sphingomonas sp. NFX23]|uniref:M61 family metallopeptidase n=1 Tax=Sphingomonas sp. NFX23 TaxID=2819532 RepID=UPI003CF54074